MINGWGRYGKYKVKLYTPNTISIVKEKLKKSYSETFICRGLGRSYGDSSINSKIINLSNIQKKFKISKKKNEIECTSNFSIKELLPVLLKENYFLNVTSGTQYVTVGGAIASDIHGKNHHIEGCFSECIKEFNIMLEDGEVVACSKKVKADLFKATCGGQGLTGIILDAKIYLKKINSQYINQTTIKTKNLEETFEAFKEHQGRHYLVAWIDCLAKGDKIGKSILIGGDFQNDGNLDYKVQRQKNIPLNFLSFLLNNWTVRAFNWLYYNRIKHGITKQTVGLDTFFYPLDAIKGWNLIYGKNGFTQYQFILPKVSSYEGLKEILIAISKSGKGSFLSVLKLYGRANENYLSFPMEGYSLALDFKIEKGLFNLLDELDEIVVKYKGRIYLAKDVRIRKEAFEIGYPKIETFRQYRREHKMYDKFQSLQSKRVGI